MERLEHDIGLLYAKYSSGAKPVHWVVQELIPSIVKGHLSNERRLAEAKRDWIVELEPGARNLGEQHPLSLRNWRDKRPPTLQPLKCAYKEVITSSLKDVASWTHQQLKRIHYEWVWDGNTVFLVQAEMCEDVAGGVDPHALLPKSAMQPVATAGLALFRKANRSDFKKYKKLANVAIYEKLGYTLGPFYLCDDQSVLRGLLKDGKTSEALNGDLAKLTSERALVIRTDGLNIPPPLREMLPRSDELRDASSAIAWLTSKFKERVLSGEADGTKLERCDLCLIAHHFVPSIASAWSQADPGKRRVRIEALWGIPEGLQWYPYDVFDVDTLKVDASGARPRRLTVREKIRHKERFIAADDAGKWVLRNTSIKADWARTIKKQAWIEEIAWTTRQVAEANGKPTVVMWLVGCARGLSRSGVLPWYHQDWNPDAARPKLAPKKRARDISEVAKIGTLEEWRTLSEEVGRDRNVSRIQIEPREPEIVRNQQFIEQLGRLCKTKDITVELAGGLLSHAYYMLARAGCKVESADLDSFAFEDAELEFNKLVRDEIPASISAQGEAVSLKAARGAAYVEALRRKLVEEAFEVLDARTADQIRDEIADVEEVLLSLMREFGIPHADVESARKAKLARRGGFKKGLLLTKTSVPASVTSEAASGLVEARGPAQTQVITDVALLPSPTPEGVHVDLRRDAGGTPERQLTTQLPVYSAMNGPHRTTFSLETQAKVDHQMIVDVRVEREASQLRVRMRLVNVAEQLSLALEPDEPTK